MNETTVNNVPFEQALERFIESDEFGETLIASTKASWEGSGYSVELFPDGHFRVLWDNQIGNLYDSPGVILSVPPFDDDDYVECVHDNQMPEEEYWQLCYEEKDSLVQQMRETLSFHTMLSMSEGE